MADFIFTWGRSGNAVNFTFFVWTLTWFPLFSSNLIPLLKELVDLQESRKSYKGWKGYISAAMFPFAAPFSDPEVPIKGLFTRRWVTPDRWGNMWRDIYHVNVIKLKWEIIWTGGLPHLSGLPHLPGVPPPPPPCKQALRLRTDVLGSFNKQIGILSGYFRCPP